MVITDQQRLEQILKNLLSNAIKFTGQGEVKLNISKSDEPMELRSKMYNPGEVLLFSVIDTGIGIEENKQAMIFEAFQQADGGLSRQYGGTGLGLTISRQIAALLGGEIRLKSQLGEGSEFTLYLPINQTITVGVNSPSVIPLKSADEKPVKEKPAPSVAKASNSEASISPVISSTVTVQDDRDQIKPDDHSILIIEDDHNFADILKKEIHNHGLARIYWLVRMLLWMVLHLYHILVMGMDSPVHYIILRLPTMGKGLYFRKGGVDVNRIATYLSLPIHTV